MIQIDLYQPNAVDASIQFPSEWNEFTLPELHLVSKSILSNFATPAQAAAGLFLSLLKIRTGKKVKDIEKRLDAEDAVINGLPATDFIYKENNLTKEPYKKLYVRWPAANSPWLMAMHGRDDDFNNLTCGEFEDCEIFYNQFIIEPNAIALANLAAILYRTQGKKYLRLSPNDGWVQYNSEKMVPSFIKLKPWILYSIFLWYAGCRAQLPKIFPNCFGSAAPPSGGGGGEPDFMIFTKCIHAGAGPKNGSRNDIRCTLLKEFFLEIELQNIENEKIKNDIENAR